MIARWTDAEDRLLARDILGTDDAAVACAAVEAWASRHGLGRAVVTDVALSVGAGITLMRDDASRLFVKVWPGRADAGALALQLAAQHRLAAAGFPAPGLLAGPASLGRSTAAAMRYVRPGAAAAVSPPRRRAMASLLARLAAEPGLEALPARVLPEGAVWPRPHSALFDFAATAAGAEWIDGIAREALATLRVGAGRIVPGHLDWSPRNLRFAGDDVAMVYDWDSLFRERETVIVGSAAAQFLVAVDDHASRGAAPAEAAAFVADYQAASGWPFTAAERDGIAAAARYAWAYTARCEHALDPERTRWSGSTREALRRAAPFHLG